MKNNEANRLKLSQAIWDTLSLADLHEQFIFQNLERYKTDPDAFEEDCAAIAFDIEKDGE